MLGIRHSVRHDWESELADGYDLYWKERTRQIWVLQIQHWVLVPVWQVAIRSSSEQVAMSGFGNSVWRMFRDARLRLMISPK